MKGNEVFFDTNIFVYAVDTYDGAKHGVARSLINSVFTASTNGCVSNQVLAELYCVLTSKLKRVMDPDTAKSAVLGIISSNNWKKINYTDATVRLALSFSSKKGSDIWDSLIAATMLENSITEIYTENISDFAGIPGITARNPFAKI